jgi:hypothetical protein
MFIKECDFETERIGTNKKSDKRRVIETVNTRIQGWIKSPIDGDITAEYIYTYRTSFLFFNLLARGDIE